MNKTCNYCIPKDDGDLADYIFITDLKMNGLAFLGIFSYIDEGVTHLVVDDGFNGREFHTEDLGFKYCPMCGRELRKEKCDE